MKTEQATFPTMGTKQEQKLDPNAFYNIDWNKVRSIEDLALIIAAVGFNFVGNHPRIDVVKHLLDYDNPMYPPAPPKQEQPKLKKIELPKIKKPEVVKNKNNAEVL